MAKQIIAILGGMGPQASVRMLDEVVGLAASKFGAKNCEDFPEIILFSLPVPDFISGKDNLSKALAMLKKKVRLMNKMKVSSVAMACNTAHLVFDDLQRISRVPFISVIEVVADEVSHQGLRKVGVLGSPNTIKSGLFKQALKRRGIVVVVPDKKRENEVEIIIRKVIAGQADIDDSQKLVKIAASLKQGGAEGIILGCTELPLIFPDGFPLPVFDSIKITAEALLRPEG